MYYFSINDHSVPMFLSISIIFDKNQSISLFLLYKLGFCVLALGTQAQTQTHFPL